MDRILSNKKSGQFNNRFALNADELCQRIGLSKWTVYRLVAEKKIPHVKVGKRILFPVGAIEKWLEERGRIRFTLSSWHVQLPLMGIHPLVVKRLAEGR